MTNDRYKPFLGKGRRSNVCLLCGKPLADKLPTGRKCTSNFCNANCSSLFQYHNNIEYKKRNLERTKARAKTPEGKALQKRYFKTWYEKNKERHKAYMRAYLKKKRAEAKR